MYQKNRDCARAWMSPNCKNVLFVAKVLLPPAKNQSLCFPDSILRSIGLDKKWYIWQKINQMTSTAWNVSYIAKFLCCKTFSRQNVFVLQLLHCNGLGIEVNWFWQKNELGLNVSAVKVNYQSTNKSVTYLNGTIFQVILVQKCQNSK